MHEWTIKLFNFNYDKYKKERLIAPGHGIGRSNPDLEDWRNVMFEMQSEKCFGGYVGIVEEET